MPLICRVSTLEGIRLNSPPILTPTYWLKCKVECIRPYHGWAAVWATLTKCITVIFFVRFFVSAKRPIL